MNTRNQSQDALWHEASDIAEYVYGKLHELPDEEKWQTGARLRSEANGLMYFTACAVGSAAAASQESDWGYVRRAATALRVVYRFACRQKFLTLDPEIMVRLDALLKQADAAIAESRQRLEEEDRKDFEHWHKKYELARKVQHES